MANDPRLDWWDRKEFAGYVRNFYRKHSYRLFKYWEEEDAHQEMYLKFLRVLQTYPSSAEAPTRDGVIQSQSDELGQHVRLSSEARRACGVDG